MLPSSLPPRIHGSPTGPVVRIEAPEPIQLTSNRFIREVCRVHVLWTEFSRHGIDESCPFVVAPLRELGDVKGDEHTRSQRISMQIAISEVNG